MDTVVASLVQAAAATSGFTDRHCTNPERWLGWAPDTFGWNWALLVSSVIAFVGGSMSASVGVGGGGVYVPLLIVVMCLDAHQAVPVSKVCILGVAITTLVINFRKRHPQADRPLINYSVALLMAPTTILGTTFGIMLFIVFPQWFILVLLIAVLAFTDYRTFAKAWELHKKEQRVAETTPILVNETSYDTQPLLIDQGHESPGSNDGSDGHTIHDANHLLTVESMTPVHKICFLVFLWLAMVALVMIRGGGENGGQYSAFGIEKCSVPFWLLTVLMAIFLISGGLIGVYLQYRRSKSWTASGVDTVEGDVVFTPLKFLGFMGVGCFAGICAGFLGIGSGMINVPYMLEVGMKPEVAAATSSFIIVFTALSTVVQYIITGFIPLKSALWFGSIGLISAVVGQFGVSALVAKYKKSSIISFLLFALITVSAIGLVAEAILKISTNIHTPGYFNFHPYCE